MNKAETIEFSEITSPDDNMMVPGQEAAYLRTSRSGLACILSALDCAKREPETIRSVLDFGSGYGRVYRAIAAAFPQAERTACDLVEPAARFCAENFGGDWVRSAEDLDQVVLPRRYDLIWLGSVFTHLPKHRWTKLLKFLAANANPGSILVFTTHGTRAIAQIENGVMKRNPQMIDSDRYALMKETVPASGFDFIPSKEGIINAQNRNGMKVTANEYGVSFTTERWIRDLFDELPEWDILNYVNAGWGNNHDVVVAKRPARSGQSAKSQTRKSTAPKSPPPASDSAPAVVELVPAPSKGARKKAERPK